MSFTRARAAGFWTFNSVVAPAEFEHIDDYYKAIDGSGGGAYAPTGVITIGGSGLNVTGQCQLSNIQAATFNCPIVGTEGATITQTTVNTAAITCTGNGTAPGITSTGGAGGSGGIFTAGGGNKYGVEGFGAGTAAGLFAQGGATGNGAIVNAGGGNAHGIAATGAGTGAGIIANPGASGSAVDANGRIIFTGAQPAATADPGANNVLHGTNVCKAWANISTDAVGGITLNDGYNVAGVLILASRIVVTWARVMANSTYTVTFGNLDTTLRFYSVDGPLAMVPATITIVTQNTLFATLDPATNALRFMLQVFARQ